MLNRKYNRIFILLNGRNEGLGMNLNGSCDIEIINGTGKLYAYIGGIGRLKQKTRQLYLLSAGVIGTTAVSAGEFEIKGSNAILETNFDPDNVFGSGMTIEAINTAAVWNTQDGPEKAILEGFVSQKTHWLKNLDIYGEKRTEEIKESNVSEEIDKLISKKTFTELESELNSAVEEKSELQAAEAVIPLDFKAHDTFRNIAEKFRKELDMLDQMGIIDKNMILGDVGRKDTINEKTERVNDEKIQQASVKNSDKTEIDVLFEKNDKMSMGGSTEWIKADYREVYMIPEAIAELRQLFVRNGARKGRHMIAGRDNGKYYIGIPGNEKQRKEAEESGFYDFLTIGDMDGNGYWIKKLRN